MRYYVTHPRGIGPGTVPKGFTAMKNFDRETYCEDISREAYGWVEYDHALPVKDAEQYELTQQGMQLWWGVIETRDGDKTMATLGPIVEAVDEPKRVHSEAGSRRVWLRWLSSREAAERLVDDLRT